jgi:tagatose 6-phosphate kinase
MERYVLTITLNAAVDKTYVVNNFTLDRVHRPLEMKSVAGGKGINVARVCKTLGKPSLASGFVGGHNGRFIENHLKMEGIPYDFVRVKGESRLCIAIVDLINKTQTEVNEWGPPVGEREARRLERKVKELLPKASFLVFCGSAPPGTPPDIFARLTKLAKDFEVPAILDTSGELLRLGLEARPFMVKPNIRELEYLIEGDLNDEDDVIEAMRAISDKAEIVVVTMGKEGAIMLAEGRIIYTPGLDVPFVSAVGSGDSFLAGFICGLLDGLSLEDCLRLGNACGAANVMVVGAGMARKEDIERLYKLATCEIIAD